MTEIQLAEMAVHQLAISLKQATFEEVEQPHHQISALIDQLDL